MLPCLIVNLRQCSVTKRFVSDPTQYLLEHLRETSEGWRAIAFIVPNDGSITRVPEDFLTSVADVEAGPD